MKILFFCPRWGSESIPWSDFVLRVRDAGYDGVEAALPFDKKEQASMLDALSQAGLKFIAQHWETAVSSFDDHCAEYEKRISSLAEAQPLFINTQTGKDYYSIEQNKTLIMMAASISQRAGVPLYHETHRGKFSFAAHIMEQYLDLLPDLRITLDVSHWFTVAETFLHDQQTAVTKALQRTDHIHARIGFTQGPQVNDPRAPEWTEATGHHLVLWGRIIALRKQEGKEYMSITTEFGAPPYLPLHPYTQKPLASQWDSNVYVMEMLKSRYKAEDNYAG